MMSKCAVSTNLLACTNWCCQLLSYFDGKHYLV